MFLGKNFYSQGRDSPGVCSNNENVFLPKPEYKEEMPALLVELKWNQKAYTALEQIKEKQYVQAIKNYTGDILFVGISYDKKNKKHECAIEGYRIEA